MKAKWRPIPPPRPAVSEAEQIDRLLAQARAGERDAWARVLRQTYGELRRLAHYHLQLGLTMPTLDTTSLVSEWYLRLCESDGVLPNDRRHFFALAGKIMRQVVCGYARDRLTDKRGGGRLRLDISALDDEVRDEAEQFLALDQALDRLAEDDVDLVRVVECRYFAGMTEPETAEALDCSLRSVQRAWTRARDRLTQMLAD